MFFADRSSLLYSFIKFFSCFFFLYCCNLFMATELICVFYYYSIDVISANNIV
jgi:hypothetical protein